MHHTSRRMGDREVQSQLSGALNRHEMAKRAVEEEYAAKYTAEKRRQALKDGDALPGDPPKFPIKDQEDMDSAADLLGNTSLPRATVVAHMRKQAKKHGLTLPSSLRGGSSS